MKSDFDGPPPLSIIGVLSTEPCQEATKSMTCAGRCCYLEISDIQRGKAPLGEFPSTLLPRLKTFIKFIAEIFAC